MTHPIQCPACATCVEVDAGLLGQQVQCGRCDQVFVAQPANGPDSPAVRPVVGLPRYDLDMAPPPPDGSKGTVSLVLGIFGLVAWCLPIVGLPMTITGLVFGVKSVNSPNRGAATIGMVLNVFGLLLSLLNAAVGAYLGATGQHPLFPR